MTISSEIVRIQTAIADAYTACQDMGATMPAVLNSDNLEQCIASITGGQPAAQGRFVAITGSDANSKATIYSDDGGETWTAGSVLPYKADWQEIAYGNGVFVAVSYSPTSVAYSTDGITWTASTLPSDNSWISVTYGNGVFVAIANDSNVAAYSTDGINWTSSTLPSSSGWRKIAFGNNKFVAISSSSSGITYSDDGITWTAVTYFPQSRNWAHIVYGGDKWVAFPGITSNSSAAYSSDGINWTMISLPVQDYWEGLAYGDGKFVVIANNSSNALYSTDGITWSQKTLPSTKYWHDVVYGNGRFVAVAYATDEVAYSTNGETWLSSTMPSSDTWWNIAYGEITPQPTPSGTTLHQYDRVDGKATVAGFWTDGNGQRYAVCVVDAQYRSGGAIKWSNSYTDTSLSNYSTSALALAASESGTYNTDTILDNYTATDYPAFNFAHNACTVSIDNKTFESCLPNLAELNILYQDRTTLDTYDQTLSSYSARSLSSWHFGQDGAWSSNEKDSDYAWYINNYGNCLTLVKYQSGTGVCPIIEIPVDENGEVQ